MWDHGLELDVWCCHKKEGCEWRGKLGELEVHTNCKPSPKDQHSGCSFVAVECKHTSVGSGFSAATSLSTRVNSVRIILTAVNTAETTTLYTKM